MDRLFENVYHYTVGVIFPLLIGLARLDPLMLRHAACSEAQSYI